MSLDTDKESSPPIGSIDDLVAFFRRAERPRADWKVGMEHEKIGFLGTTPTPVPYEGPRGIREVLERFARFGYEPWLEDGRPIAGRRPGSTLSLEPGGQFELSGRPYASVHECREELLRHVAQAKAIGAELGIQWVGVGYRPFGTTDAMPWMPKARYAVMREYMPRRGRLALDMMLMTATVQANFDFDSEADMAAKMRAAMSVSSLVSAIWANSFLVDGRDEGWSTYRYAVWNETDPDRCGLLPFVFEPDFGYRRWVEYALDVPMFFVRRAGRYIQASHLTFRRYMQEGLEGHRATIGDFEDHLTTLFPEVRLKTVIEVRGADVADSAMNAALTAMWKGLLYDREALAAAEALTAGLSFEERLQLQRDVARHGLRARCRRGAVLDLARELYRIAAEGLRRIDCRNAAGDDERVVLAPAGEVVETGRAPADVWRERWHGELGRDPARLIAAMAY
jgi:glutamate--cysteine ligase